LAFNLKNWQHQRLEDGSLALQAIKALLIIAIPRNDAQEQKLFTPGLSGYIPERLHPVLGNRIDLFCG